MTNMSDPGQREEKRLLFWTVAGPLGLVVFAIGSVAAVAGLMLRRLIQARAANPTKAQEERRL